MLFFVFPKDETSLLVGGPCYHANFAVCENFWGSAGAGDDTGSMGAEAGDEKQW